MRARIAGVWNEKALSSDIVSSSAVSNMQVDISNKTVSFNLITLEYGFFRVTIPNIIVQDLWHGNYAVLLKDEQWPFANWTDASHAYIYVSYMHSEHEVTIIPEYPSTLTALIIIALTTVAIAFVKKRKTRNLASAQALQ